MNTMWFKLRDCGSNDNGMTHQVNAENETLETLMRELFTNDDYMFKFQDEPPFENLSPWETVNEGVGAKYTVMSECGCYLPKKRRNIENKDIFEAKFFNSVEEAYEFVQTNEKVHWKFTIDYDASVVKVATIVKVM